MTIKFERQLYVQCDSCKVNHSRRSLSSNRARIVAGVDGWELIEQRDHEDKLEKLDICPDCTDKGLDGQVQRDIPQGSDAGGAGQEEN